MIQQELTKFIDETKINKKDIDDIILGLKHLSRYYSSNNKYTKSKSIENLTKKLRAK